MTQPRKIKKSITETKRILMRKALEKVHTILEFMKAHEKRNVVHKFEGAIISARNYATTRRLKIWNSFVRLMKALAVVGSSVLLLGVTFGVIHLANFKDSGFSRSRCSIVWNFTMQKLEVSLFKPSKEMKNSSIKSVSQYVGALCIAVGML